MSEERKRVVEGKVGDAGGGLGATKEERKKDETKSTAIKTHQLPVDRVGQALPRELAARKRGLIVDAGEQEVALDDLDDLFFLLMMTNWFRSK